MLNICAGGVLLKRFMVMSEEVSDLHNVEREETKIKHVGPSVCMKSYIDWNASWIGYSTYTKVHLILLPVSTCV